MPAGQVEFRVARNTRLRDQNCIGPGCTRTARRSDLDHTLDPGKGGDTVEENAGPACYRHHPDKDRGWTLSQPAPGRFVWVSPLGRVHHTRGEPIRHDLPDPQPFRHHRYKLASEMLRSRHGTV
ncbi:hypothetical protein [Pseudonocardia sp. GCM10023141]|uniref:hypothetical protein n=1 Tax=Pseudonocardia sp. GCM10023141 TaxID=3252653 RepID=UPI003619E8DA